MRSSKIVRYTLSFVLFVFVFLQGVGGTRPEYHYEALKNLTITMKKNLHKMKQNKWNELRIIKPSHFIWIQKVCNLL